MRRGLVLALGIASACSWLACSSSSNTDQGGGQDAALDGSGSDDGAAADRTVPTGDGAPEGATASEAGGDAHADSASSDGGLDATTDGDAGAADSGPEAEAAPPCVIEAGATLNDVLEVSAGGYGQACAIRSDRSVVCWGQNQDGQSGAPDAGAGAFSAIPQRVTFPADAGTVVAEHVSCGTSISCIIDSDSRVWCWGNDGFGQVGNGVVVPGLWAGAPEPPSLVLTSDGLPLTASAISAAGQHACALTLQNDIVCWGYNGSGAVTSLPDAGTSVPFATPYPATLDGGGPLLAPATGAYYSCATDNARTLCWGENPNGGVAPLQDAGVQYGGTLAAQITSAGGQFPLTSIGVGEYNACVIDSAHTLYCWGQLAKLTNDAGPASSPVAISLGDAGVPAKVTVGWGFFCVLTTDGRALCYGQNAAGQLGSGGVTPFQGALTPVVGPDGGGALSGVASLSAGDNDVCALLQSPCGPGGPGSVVCWGLTTGGVLQGYPGGGAGIPVPTPVLPPAP